MQQPPATTESQQPANGPKDCHSLALLPHDLGDGRVVPKRDGGEQVVLDL